VKYSFLRWTLISAGMGLFGPIVWFFVLEIIGRNALPPFWLGPVMLVIWPSSFWLTATDGIEGTPRAYMFILLSVGANVALYTLLGTAVWWVKHLLTQAKR